MAKAEVDQIAHTQRAVEATVANLAIGISSGRFDKNVERNPAVPNRRRATSEASIGEVYLGELEAKAQAKSIGILAVKLLFRTGAVD